MAALIRFKRGNEANLNTVSLSAGEPAFTLDTEKLFIGNNGLKIEIGNNTVGPVTTLVRANSATWGNVYEDRAVDKRIITSYKSWIWGSYSFADQYGVTKIQYIQANAARSLTVTLCAVTVNGRKLPMIDNGDRITLIGAGPQANVLFASPPAGYGTPQYVINYQNFVNNILSKYNIKTNIWGGFIDNNVSRFRVYANHNVRDDFSLLFEERLNVASGDPQPQSNLYYILKSTDFWTLGDNIETSYQKVIYAEPFATQLIRAWTPARISSL